MFRIAANTLATSVLPTPASPSKKSGLPSPSDKKITVAILLPWFIRRLLSRKDKAENQWPEMRSVLSSSSVFFPEERREFQRRYCRFLFDNYGANEVGSISQASVDDLEKYPHWKSNILLLKVGFRDLFWLKPNLWLLTPILN